MCSCCHPAAALHEWWSELQGMKQEKSTATCDRQMESSSGNIREGDVVPKVYSKATGMPWKTITVAGEIIPATESPDQPPPPRIAQVDR